MDNKTQKMNIVLSLTAFAVVVVIVCVVGIYTFRHREPEIVQGQAEVSEYRVSSKVPGRILKILVQEGQQVKADDVVCILEAMKMGNEIHAGVDGTVKSIEVSKEDSVLEGNTIMVIG